MIFTRQQLYCNVCGQPFMTDFNNVGGYGRDRSCCSKRCHDEREWRKTLAIMGKVYRPREESNGG